jgi:predicted protein tyrosine phosphatase
MMIRNNISENRNHDENRAVRVYSLAELEAVIEAGEPRLSHCISIANPDQEAQAKAPFYQKLEKMYQKVLHLRFYDAKEGEKFSRFIPNEQRILPGPEHIRAIVDFYRDTAPVASGWDIHCHRGIARSGVAALIILYLIHQNERSAASHLHHIRDIAMPHTGMIRIFDRQYGSNLEPYRIKLHRIALDALFGEPPGNYESDWIDDLDLSI